MNLTSCLYPKRIYNQYVGDYMTVPCGKCHACTIRHGNAWVSRLEQERLCWSFTIFFTLTYDEEFVPYLEKTVSGGLPCFIGHNTLYSISPDDYFELDSDSQEYLYRIDKLRVLNSKHLQNFIKRLRYHVTEKCRFEGKEYKSNSFRYYCIGEYGETTLRPHYHGLIFTNSKLIVDNFDELLVKSWSCYDPVTSVYRSFGRTDWSLVISSASSYCAQYLNCTANLPKVLANSKVRPFNLQSRKPPIGSLLQSDSQILQIFHNASPFIAVRTSQEIVTTTLPRYLKDRLFPKCPRFSQVLHPFRVSLYGLGEQFYQFRETYEELKFLEVCRYFLDWIKLTRSDFVYDYVEKLTYNFVDVRPFARLIYISLRVIRQAEVFGVSLEYYVSRIEQYYDNVAQFTLRNWFGFQEVYLKTHPLTDIISVDLDFLDKYANGKLSLKDYGYEKEDCVCSSLDYRTTDNYRELKFKSYKKYHETSKTKKKNDYLEAHPEKCMFVYG